MAFFWTRAYASSLDNPFLINANIMFWLKCRPFSFSKFLLILFGYKTRFSITLVNLFCDFFRYGGPGVQFVTKKWRQHSREGIDFYLAGKKNYIVAKIDVRGTSFSGNLQKKSQIWFITTQCCQFFEPLWLFLKTFVYLCSMQLFSADP